MSISEYILKPFLSHKFSAIIWKIEVDEEIIAIETRDSGSRSAGFSAFNYVSGQCYFKERSIENSWWWGLDRVHKGLIYLHGYKSETSPEHRGIIAWDAETGETKWQQFNYTFDTVATEGLIVHNPLIQAAKPALLSPETGELIKSNIQEYTLADRQIRFPVVYDDLTLLPDFIPRNAVEPFLCLPYNTEKACWSFHIKNEDGFTQKLIITENREVILSENLAAGIQKLNPEAFFVYKNHLFCIRNNNYEIVSYLL